MQTDSIISRRECVPVKIIGERETDHPYPVSSYSTEKVSIWFDSVILIQVLLV